jgi:hypothetical protein
MEMEDVSETAMVEAALMAVEAMEDVRANDTYGISVVAEALSTMYYCAIAFENEADILELMLALQFGDFAHLENGLRYIAERKYETAPWDGGEPWPFIGLEAYSARFGK